MMRTVLIALFTAAALGCGKKEEAEIHPVSGEVQYEGKPAAGVQVYLIPTSHVLPKNAASNPHGITGADGRFTLGTVATDDGAPDGKYQVVLLWPVESSEEVESPRDRLQGWYDARHSKLEAVVKAESSALPVFKLAAVKGPPPASEGIPGRN
jgi:hypothetical protein